MPDYAKVFTYEVDGLTYTVSLYEEGGEIKADVTVLEGSMDLNAVYWGDDDFSGRSENLGGPLNMNGSSLDGEKVQWDGATEVSDPGLGPDGEDKDSFLTEGETFTVTLDADSLDDIDVVGVRATSTSTEDGSIKGVSDDPEDPEDPEDPLYEKVFFGEELGENGEPLSGAFILGEVPAENPFNVPVLPEELEPTFDNYVAYYQEIGGDITNVQSVIFYETNADGNPEELFRLDAPEGGFADADALLMTYDDYLDAQGDALSGADLMAALSLGPIEDDPALDMQLDDEMDDEVELI
ncbi:hypothetical protein [Aestuariivita boseongensis]|uniref:hypothetical protein n=1 Tax=Aestuariivita boseongensis TaxID=1470562 RepID=UPI000680ADDD|nr:hypothetical protein [Aestuariivita boseongensis]